MLKQRIITAVIGLPLILSLLIYANTMILTFFFIGFVALSVYEISGIILPALRERSKNEEDVNVAKHYWHRWQLFAVGAGVFMFVVSTFGDYEAGRGGIVLVMSSLMLAGVFLNDNIENSVLQLVGLIVSICYGCLPWLAVWDLSIMAPNSRYMLLALGIVMMNDTGAYFGGVKFGKRRLAPKLSPKKSWEGAISGVFTGIIGALLVNLAFQNTLGPWWLMVIAGLGGGITGILGDLVESGFKRFGGVKDSGKIIPGHGGFLDRVDSLLFAAPTLWFIFYVYRSV